MTHRMFVVFLISLFAFGLSAQETFGPIGVAIGFASPQQLHASNGSIADLNIYFNRESLKYGRLRFEGVNFGAKTETSTVTTLESKGYGLTVGYDWMPGNEHIRAILGIGGMYWSQTLNQQDLGPFLGEKAYGGNQTGFSIVPALGIQFRVSRFVSIEGRYAFALNISNNKHYYFSYQENSDIRQMNYFSILIEYHPPSFR